MDKRKALINIIISTGFKVIVMVFGLVSRRFLVNILGDEANGLYSLYISILGLLSIAELGIGTAIIFSMYKPIVNKEKDVISALYYYYRKIYLRISLVIFIAGIVVMFFLPTIAKDHSGKYNFYITFFYFLSATVITYFYAHKVSFINAHMDNYIPTTVRSLGLIIESILQIIIIKTTNSFNYFLLAIVISNLLQMLVINLIFKVKYSKSLTKNKKLSDEKKTEVIRKTKAMFFHKIGGLLVNTSSSIIISSFIGIVILGKYSNYITIITGVMSILSLMFASMSSVIGQSYSKNTKEVFKNQFIKIHIINYIVSFIFFFGILVTFQYVISMIFSKEVLLDYEIVLVLVINYFIQFNRQTILTFKDASGAFEHDKYKPLFEGVLNVIIALALAQSLGVVGVLIASIVTNLTICHIVEPFVLFKYGLSSSPKKFYLMNYFGMFIFIVIAIVYTFIPIKVFNNSIHGFLITGTLSVLASIFILFIIYLLSKTFRKETNEIIKSIFSFIFKQKEH